MCKTHLRHLRDAPLLTPAGTPLKADKGVDEFLAPGTGGQSAVAASLAHCVEKGTTCAHINRAKQVNSYCGHYLKPGNLLWMWLAPCSFPCLHVPVGELENVYVAVGFSFCKLLFWLEALHRRTVFVVGYCVLVRNQ